MTAAEEAIRRAVPILRDVFDWDREVGGDALPDEIRDDIADLLSVLDGSEPVSGPTTAQEGRPQSNESRRITTQERSE